MERGTTRLERALVQKGTGIEWHVYRMGHLTDYYVGTVRNERGKWRAISERIDDHGHATRRKAVAALCHDDDKH